MLRLMLYIIFVGLSFDSPAAEGHRLKVVASIPDWADMAREIGGERVEVECLTQGTEDIHGVPIRPSMAAKLAGADVVIETGLDNEHAWLPALIGASNNQKILRGKGRIVATEGLTPLEIPTNLSRTEGEVHAEGNPHMNLDPGKGQALAANIAKGLIENAPEHKAEFEERLKKYQEQIAAKEIEWRRAGEKLKGAKFVSYHNCWAYWAEYLGMEYVGTLEVKPGVPPSGGHIAELIKQMQAQGAKIVVREPQFSEKLPKEIAAKVNGKVVKLAVMVGGLPEARTWISMIDANLTALLKAVDEPTESGTAK